MSSQVLDLETRADAELAVIAGQLNVQHAQAVRTIAGALEYGTWQGDGISSPEHWLRLQIGVSAHQSRQLVRVARKYAEFPAVMAEFATGAMSLDQVDVVVTRAPAWADTRMAGFAGGLTVPQLHRIIRDDFFDGPTTDATAEATADATTGDDGAAVPAEPTPESTPGAAPLPGDRFDYGWNELGRLVGHFDLGAEYGKVAEALFDKIRNDLFEAHSATPSGGDVLLETLARAACYPTDTTLLDGWGNGSRPGDTLGRFRTFLHLELTADGTRLLAEFTDHSPLPQALREYLTCDGDIAPVWMRDNTPVGYGRTQRIVPTKLRRQVERRDHGCRVPGCGAKHFEVHHIVHWEDGGVTETWNLVCLCPRHHHLLHLGQLSIRGNPDEGTLEFLDSRGNPIRGPAYVKPDAPPPPVAAYDPPSGERLNLRDFWGWVHPDVAAERARKTAAFAAQYEAQERAHPPRDIFAYLGRAW